MLREVEKIKKDIKPFHQSYRKLFDQIKQNSINARIKPAVILKM
jgi:hypothetical protein